LKTIDLGPDDSIRLIVGVAPDLAVTLSHAQLRAVAVVLRHCLLTGEPLCLEVVEKDIYEDEPSVDGWQGECGDTFTDDLHPGPWEALVELAAQLEATAKEDHP